MLYVYPAPGVVSIGSPPEVVAGAHQTLFDREFDTNVQGLLHHYPSSELLLQEDYRVVQNGEPVSGRHAELQYRTQFMGRYQVVRSHLFLFRHHDYLYKFRITYPSEVAADAQVEQFVGAF